MWPRLGIRGKVKGRLMKMVLGRDDRSAQPRLRQVWAIGVYGGDSPLDLHPIEGVQNPVLTRDDVSDVGARFVADPFAIHVQGQWFLFFEIVDRASRKGQIGVATSQDGLRWVYRGIVLAEPFHLSYPYVFSWDERYYMIPETGATKAVRLYRADAFPQGWRYVGSLLEGLPYLDASVFRWANRWWLFAGVERGGEHDTLHLFTSADLLGPWQEHPASPVVSGDSRAARPAGKPLLWEGRLFRFAQDCFPRYGAAVRVFEVRRLTPEEYEEVEAQPHPVLAASGLGWNALGMHHIDLHPRDGRWLAFVDGRVDLPE